MEFSKDLLANTVPDSGQLPNSQYVTFHYEEGAKKKVLFVGNSITLHGPRKSVGWSGNWGMAASEEAKDYVHLTVDGLRERFGPINWGIAQAAIWERAFTDLSILHEQYADARAFGADIVIVRIGENLSRALLATEELSGPFAEMVRFFAPEGTERILVSDLFWASPVMDEPIRRAVQENGWTLVPLGDLGQMDENKALGLFEHDGVARHPGDRGMRAIADRILGAL